MDMTTQNILFVLSLGALISVFVSTEFIPWLVIAHHRLHAKIRQ